MSWVNDFLGRVNRKCANCGQLLLEDSEQVRTVDEAAVCSEWCADYYRRHKADE